MDLLTAFLLLTLNYICCWFVPESQIFHSLAAYIITTNEVHWLLTETETCKTL